MSHALLVTLNSTVIPANAPFALKGAYPVSVNLIALNAVQAMFWLAKCAKNVFLPVSPAKILLPVVHHASHHTSWGPTTVSSVKQLIVKLALLIRLSV